MSKKVMLSIPDDIYGRLELASAESMRPIATEALYRVRLGLDSSFSGVRADSAGSGGPFLPEAIVKPDADDFEDMVVALETKIGSFDPDYMDDGIQKELLAECKRISGESGWSWNKGGYFWNSEGERRYVKGWK